VPQTVAAPVGALASTPTSATKNDDMMKNLPAPGYGSNDSDRPRVLMVEVLGAGDSEDVRIEKKKDDRKGDDDQE
jgi:hypothetical protein